MAVASLMAGSAGSSGLYDAVPLPVGFVELPVVILWTVHTLLFNVVKPGEKSAPVRRGRR